MNGDDNLNIGAQLRTLREARGLSLRALAEISGLSTNAISRIERDEVSPTVASLHALARALDISLTALFHAAGNTSVVLVRADARMLLRQDHVHIEVLGYGLPNQRLEPFMVTLQPGAGIHHDPVTHPGQEFAVCIQGQLVYTVAGIDHDLATGDSILFDATLPHSFHNPGQVIARFVLVFNSPSDNRSARDSHLAR